MSTVDDVRNGWGNWDLDFRPDTPLSIVAACNPERFPFALVRIYSAQIDAGQVGTTPGLWSGLLMRSAPGSIGGFGPAWLAGTPGGSVWEPRTGGGPFTVSTVTYDGVSTGSLTDWVTLITTGFSSGLTPGFIGGPSFKKPGTLMAKTTRTVLDSFLRVRFGVEWRITAELALDVGYRAQLYPDTAVPIATRDGGRDPEQRSLQVTDLGLESDWSDWASQALVVRTEGGAYGSSGTSVVNNPGTGSTMNWRTVSESTGQDAGEAQDQANEAFLDTGRTRSAKISASEYDLPSYLPVGSSLDVWDPGNGFYDQTAPERSHLGQVIRPVRLRVEGVKWPVQEGMSVWLDRRNITGDTEDLIDLTPHIAWAAPDADTELTVGAVPARLR